MKMIDMNFNWDWHSHLSVLKFFVNEYEICDCVEHGTGIHSTPLLKSGCENYYGLEENEMFMQEMIDTGVYLESDVELLNTPDGVEIFTRYSDFTDHQQFELNQIYSKKRTDIGYDMTACGGFKLLFVDGYAGTRNAFFEKVYDLFDIIILHDTEPGSYETEYQYTFKSEKYKELFNIYSVTTPVPYTSFMVRKNIPINTDVLRRYMDEYCDMLEWEHEKMDILIH